MSQPNILFVICHDIGDYLPCYGTPVEAPAFRRLADEGVVFSNHFSTGTVCSPSRGSIMTGMYPHSNGLMGLVHRGWALDVDRCPTIPSILAQHGYSTHLFGFQHEHWDRSRLGYDHLHDTASHYADDVEPVVIDWLESGQAQASGPFYASVGLFETHRMGSDPSHFRREGYRPASLDEVVVPPYLPDIPEVRADLAEFYGAVGRVDRMLERILEALDAQGLTDDTLVIFSSDHGASFMHAKATLYDGGTKVALLMRWPGRIGAGRRVEAMTSHVDILPTLFGWLGVDVPRDVEGHDVGRYVSAEGPVDGGCTFAEKNYTNYFDPARMARTTRFKYIKRGLKRSVYDFCIPEIELNPSSFRRNKQMMAFYSARRCDEELYDLAADPGELRNVAEDPAYAHTLVEMRGRLDDHLVRTRDPFRQMVNGLHMPEKTYDDVRGARG